MGRFGRAGVSVYRAGRQTEPERPAGPAHRSDRSSRRPPTNGCARPCRPRRPGRNDDRCTPEPLTEGHDCTDFACGRWSWSPAWPSTVPTRDRVSGARPQAGRRPAGRERRGRHLLIIERRVVGKAPEGAAAAHPGDRPRPGLGRGLSEMMPVLRVKMKTPLTFDRLRPR